MQRHQRKASRNPIVFACWNLVLASLFIGGCTPYNVGVQPANPQVLPELEQGPVVASFDAGKQNQIFQDVMAKVESGASCQAPERSPQVRFITIEEYRNTINAGLQIQMSLDDLKSQFPVATTVLGYRHLRQFNILSPEKLEAMVQLNENVAKRFLEQHPQLLNCGQTKDQCLSDWFDESVPKLWRQNLDLSTKESLHTLFTSLGQEQDALQALVERLLAAPQFLYRKSFFPGSSTDSWSVATSLSDSLWAGAITKDLIDKASRGDLKNRESIALEVEQMMADERFYEGLLRFVGQWLQVEQIRRKEISGENGFQLNDELREALVKEASSFLYFLAARGEDSLQSIFTADFTVGDPVIAQTYGLSEEDLSAAFGLPHNTKKILFPENRRGILSQPSFALVSSNQTKTNPALRGKRVLESFLCHNLETPENIADVVANTQFDRNLSVIDAFDQATNVGSCGECHKFVNGPGFGMEDMAFTGHMQQLDDHDKAVFPEGELWTASGQKFNFTGVAGLGQALTETKELGVCIAVQSFRMVYGRLEEPSDSCDIAKAYQRAQSKGGSFSDILTEIILEKTQAGQ